MSATYRTRYQGKRCMTFSGSTALFDRSESVTRPKLEVPHSSSTKTFSTPRMLVTISPASTSATGISWCCTTSQQRRSSASTRTKRKKRSTESERSMVFQVTDLPTLLRTHLYIERHHIHLLCFCTASLWTEIKQQRNTENVLSFARIKSFFRQEKAKFCKEVLLVIAAAVSRQ